MCIKNNKVNNCFIIYLFNIPKLFMKFILKILRKTCVLTVHSGKGDLESSKILYKMYELNIKWIHIKQTKK